uniref:Centriole, cilia and spindle-associated protein-like n=1 Tax=Stegastes partitus TaxID=144197 RepID=A0A3B5AB84_9TELE
RSPGPPQSKTEYMKKFRDPKWETFSKCYEDSLKYRLTRRVMEHSHKPWFWEGWDSGSDSSGWSTPKLTRNKVAPLSLPPATTSEVKQKLWELKISPGPKPPSEEVETEVGTGEAPVVEAPANPVPRRRHRRRTPRSEPGRQDSSQDGKPAVVRKPSRAKSQPPISTKEKENRRPSSRLDWTERHVEVSNVCLSQGGHLHTSDACVQTRRESDKRSSNLDRRRARSADLEKMNRSQLTVVDDRWMTEYMRCFSARLR